MKTKWFVSVLFISLSTLMYAQSPFGYIKGMFRVGDVEVGCISKEGDTIIDPLLVKYLANGNGFVLASSETYGFSESYPGYIDTNGTFFPHKYRISVPPYKGKALGIRNDKLFLLDASGTEKEICDADFVYPFYDGMARVRKDEKIAFVNLEGKLITDFVFNDLPDYIRDGINVWDFSDGMVAFEDERGVTSYMDRDGNYVLYNEIREFGPFSEGLAHCRLDGKEGCYVDKKGKKKSNDYFRGTTFSGGFAVAKDLEDRICILNTKGKDVFKSESNEFSSFRSLSEGLAALCSTEKELWGFMNTKGEIVIDFQFQDAEGFSGGIARVILPGGNHAIINRIGKILCNMGYPGSNFYYEQIQRMNSGKSESVVCENQNRAKLIDQNGNEIADNILIYRSRNLTGMYVQSVDQGNEEVLLRMIDSKGNDLSGLCFSIGYFNGRYFWVKRDGKYAMIDKQGVVLSKWYDELLMNYTSGDYNWELDGIIQFYHDQTIPFRLGEKWGYIDFEGKEIYGASFSKAYHFRSGKAVAFQDEKPVLLDKTGNIVPLDHDSIYEFSRWVYIAEKGGKFGFISTEGKPVGEFVYDKIEIIPDWYNTQDFEMICGYGILGDKKIALDYFGKEVDGK